MASIFQGTCRRCGFRSAAEEDAALAVLISRDHPAVGVPLNKLLVSDETGDLTDVEDLCVLVLAHPLEESVPQSEIA